MKFKVLIISIITFIIVATAFISYPIFLKKYMIYQANQKGWQLQLNQAKLTNSFDLKLSGIKAFKDGITITSPSFQIKFSSLKPKTIYVNEGNVDIKDVKNIQNDKNINTHPDNKSPIKIIVNNLTISSNVCGLLTMRNTTLIKSGIQISVHSDKITGRCFGFEGEIDALGLSNHELFINEITATQKSISTEKKTFKKSNFEINMYGINKLGINSLKINTNTASLNALKISATKINDDLGTVDKIKFISMIISSDSLESPVEIHNGDIAIGKTKSDSLSILANAEKISMKNAALSHEKLDSKHISISSAIFPDHELESLIMTDDVTIGINYQKTNYTKFSASLNETDCDKLINAIPSGMIEQISDFKFAGKIAAKLSIDTSPPKPKVKISLKNGCRITKAPTSMSVSNFKTKFKRIVPGIDKKPIEIDSGPYSKWWTPLNAITPCLPKAVMITEDAGFEHHNGFIIAAIENSIAMNIESGKFIRGGSTISMQLAKNLWLSRTKTISRKLQEFFLTTYLEQSMTKNEIMELYLNMIELGPGIYGVAQAAHEYFDKSPMSLSLGECLFLSSILPAPRQPHFNVDGILYKQWANYLQTLMRLMYERRYITEDELKLGLTEEIRKGGSKMNSEPQLSVTDEGISPDSWQ